MRVKATPRVAPMIGKANGVVVDVGPGSGEWIGLFDKETVIKVCLPSACSSVAFDGMIF